MRVIWKTLLLSLLSPLLLCAQQTNVGGITGTVRDSSGAVVAGARVTVAGVAQVGYGPDWMQLSRGAINGTPGVFFGYQIDGVDAGTGESETGEDFIAPTPDIVHEVRVTDNTDTSVGFNGGVAYELT